jgi:hypothetical protein
VKGFVYIIESPSAHDLLDGRTEGRTLGEALTLAAIPHWYSLAIDKATLTQALGPRLLEACRALGKLPILHLSVHGNQNGVQLSSGEFISWHDLRNLLLPLNQAMQGGLLICMSSCFGASGCRMAMYSDSEPSFWALVGNTGNTPWADAAVGYVTFYHLFFKGTGVEQCVPAMRVAAGDPNFLLVSGPEAKANWLAFVQKQTPSQFSQNLQRAAQQVQQP